MILYPHGPFISRGVDDIPPFSSRESNPGEPIPEFCEYWHSLEKEKMREQFPALAKRIKCVGYPGLDSEWLEYLRESVLENGTAKSTVGPLLRCLFITRKFQKNADDYGVMQHEEFMEIYETLVSLVKKSPYEIELVIKPHPSNDFKGINNLFKSSGLENWRLSYEPVAAEASRSDMIVAVPSTSILGPVMMGKPVIVLNCSVIDQFNNAWSYMRYFFRVSNILRMTWFN